MKRSSSILAFLLTGLATSLASAADTGTNDFLQRSQAIFKVLPAEALNPANPITQPKIDLGRKLYYETRISQGGKISCNSCHDLENYGVDGKPTSPGHEGKLGGRNSPTVYNAALHFRQFWDGRAADVEEQAKGPILNPIEMGMPSAEMVVEKLQSIPEYEPMFRAAFPGEANPITYDNLGLAIGAFERRLMTPSRFDAFLGGDPSVLTPAELNGLKTFLDVGCTACHNGVVIGGNSFQKLGLVRPYETKDLGRFDVTKVESDKMVFKVPSLRDIAKTGPYFHDGSVKSLEDAVRLMASHQLGQDLSQQQVASIVTFLNSLTGEINQAYIAKQ